MKLSLRDRRWGPEEPPADLWSRLGEGWRELITLVALLNRRSEYRTIPFTGPIATLTFDVAGTTRPTGVSLVSLVRTDSNVTAAVTFSWTYDGGQVSTIAFAGIAAAEWRATFHIVGAE